MSTAVLSAPSFPLFPPPAVPLRFTDGDRYEWPRTGDVWRRADGGWTPLPNDGSGRLTDAEVAEELQRSVVRWDPGHRFVPVRPWMPLLPGFQIRAATMLKSLDLDGARSAVAYVVAGNRFVPVRDALAEHDEDFAYDVPARLSIPALREALAVVLEEHRLPEISFDPSAGRFHVRYQLEPLDGRRSLGYRTVERCALTFVLASHPTEA
ncbi:MULTISPECIES: hypothetical protein [unclassified Streptomyces]|uniref:hypothetical protein n=1 Tax=unclassified Streptomyces TaxID=2593676 RepID=UPI003330AC22